MLEIKRWRGNAIAAGKIDSGFAVEWMHKDLSICLTDARGNGASLPVTALLDAFYSEVEKWVGTYSACSPGLER